ncbi:P-type cation-transporting ATPase [Colletotrichum orbiculare MAFF 240422]|uniref:P-type cation-transporting ATPase n=1 Tax=Colletotrichum orbiculare (strain 104-T / ATCC 96160 / CBS 514.97 / LARS 414 / MAFF 240422) TaxID=1213857 RepID=A0A484FE37_COLOR|nr:P-type cation-transporting ATPase [Colletotrichum orbiculare MAFF 240422]
MKKTSVTFVSQSSLRSKEATLYTLEGWRPYREVVDTLKETSSGCGTATSELEPDCKAGCCDGPREAQEKAVHDRGVSLVDSCCAPQELTRQGDDGSCTAENIIESSESTPVRPAEVEDGCKQGCCDSAAKTGTTSTGDSTFEADKKDCSIEKDKVRKNCEKGCCSSVPPTQLEKEKAPSCCEGKTSPCCDSSCIDRLALRECSSKSNARYADTGRPSSGGESCTGGRDGKPCRGHARTVRETYQAKLDALGCICRALLALGQESCCPPRPRSSIERKRSSVKSTRSLISVDACCAAPKTSKAATSSKKHSRKAQNSEHRGVLAAAFKPSAKTGDTALRVADLERGPSGGEHVILSVSGMTCTGCETKLKRTLAAVGAVKNLKTSLVLARAEFDLDPGAGSAEDVVKHLERTTEFKCEKITSKGSSIDLLFPGTPEELVNQPWPDGVTDMRVVDKSIVRVEFDAQVVGARDLVERGWARPPSLAPPRADPTLEAGSKHVRHMGFMTLLSIGLTIPVLVMAWAPLPPNEIAYGSASLALATIVQVAIAGPFYPTALKSLIFSKMVEMDLLIVLSTSAAYVFSVVSFGYLVSHKPLSTGEFFETSTLLVTLIMVGRYVGALARQKAVESISIRSLQASNAVLVVPGGQETEIDSRLLQYGDVFKIVPDTRVPTDGTVISGSSELDESMITGESRVVEKYVGSSVVAGSINGSGTLSVRLTRLPGDNTISNIAGMVDEAKLSKPKIQDIADRVASYFVPVVVSLTVVTFVIWIAVGIAVRKQSASEATIQAVTYAITVLIVSCPCAIGLAVPMVVVIASGVAAERGVIFKSADSIEVAYKTTHVVFDKTGTLTQGRLAVVEEVYIAKDTSTAKSLLLGLIGGIKHPVSTAIAAHLQANGVNPTEVSDPRTLTGKGVEATCSGLQLRAGNSRWLGFSSDSRVEAVLGSGHTAFCFAVDGELAAVFGLKDSVRPDALSTVATLQASGISVHVLSGDDDGAVRSVAGQLGIPGANVRSRCDPGDKQDYVRRLLLSTPVPAAGGPRARARKPVVIFCGDGTNDAVALAQATIGVHMNEGTDVAKSAADVVLIRPSLTGVLIAIAVSKKAIHRITFNFCWSFVYNLFAILLGSGAFVNARIPPEFAGLGELASVLPVIAAAVLLRWSKG